MTSSHADTFKDTLYDPSAWQRSACELALAARTLETTLQDFWNGVREGEWKDGKVASYFMRKASDYDRWIRGMRRLHAKIQAGGGKDET